MINENLGVLRTDATDETADVAVKPGTEGRTYTQGVWSLLKSSVETTAPEYYNAIVSVAQYSTQLRKL